MDEKKLVSFPSLEVQVSIVLKMVGTLQAHQTCFITRCIGVKMLNLGGYVVPQIYTNFERDWYTMHAPLKKF